MTMIMVMMMMMMMAVCSASRSRSIKLATSRPTDRLPIPQSGSRQRRRFHRAPIVSASYNDRTARCDHRLHSHRYAFARCHFISSEITHDGQSCVPSRRPGANVKVNIAVATVRKSR
uniref:Putative secreted protein n=1 Tax=Anopheles darlingi TaxID=43151 RepID=A0A2M4D3N0_ANODA